MKLRVSAPAVLLLSLVFARGAEASPVLIIDSGGQLIGAQNVQVGAALYDVGFFDGFCGSLFRNCDFSVIDAGLPDFAFTTQADATLAAQALLDQVFLNSALGSFDSVVFQTRGCQNNAQCQALVPWFFDPGTGFFNSFTLAVGAINTSDIPGAPLQDQVYQFQLAPSSFNTATNAEAGMFRTDLLWARFSPPGTLPSLLDPPAAVPEPASLLLIGSGIAALAARRRSRQRARRTVIG